MDVMLILGSYEHPNPAQFCEAVSVCQWCSLVVHAWLPGSYLNAWTLKLGSAILGSTILYSVPPVPFGPNFMAVYLNVAWSEYLMHVWMSRLAIVAPLVVPLRTS
jgi:hypothetical protein